MRKVFTILLFLYYTFNCSAQDNLPPTFEISSDTELQQQIDKAHYQLLADKEGKWTTEQVSQPPLVNHFHSRMVKLKGVDTTVNVYWFRYRLKNAMGKETKIALNAPEAQCDFYVFLGTRPPKHYLSGWDIAWSKKDGYKRLNAIPFTLLPGTEMMVYYRTTSYNTGISPDFSIGFLNEKYIEKEANTLQSTNIQQSFFKGIFLLAACFNFFFFLISRERVYLYLALFLFTLCLINNPIIYLTLGKEHPTVVKYIFGVWSAWTFFFLYFIRHYFQTYRYSPGWDKTLISIGAVVLLCLAFYTYSFAFHSFSYTEVETFSKVVNLGVLSVYMLCFGITPFLYIRQQRQLVKSFMLAMLPFVLQFVILIAYSAIMQAFDIENPAVDVWIAAWVDLVSYIVITWAVLYFSWFLFKRYDQQKKEIAQQAFQVERLAREKEVERSQLIEKQKVELEQKVEERTAELKQSLQDLKATQVQLVQREKMASLGELTAGIAHEIQNPLNFVNNFSEVSVELLDEQREQISNGNINESIAIADNIKDNLQKVVHHGKRADAIVKGMLQHSRSSTGEKQSTDINLLADEYLRLSYQSMRSKDKNFNATINTHFDDAIGKINIVPQDVGRVLLNLFNNAFYALQQKNQKLNGTYEPTLSISTKKLDNKIEISVKDNGNGIPPKIVDKIFQPFFTTKPTGEGTGLGLSLSYDIIKAHGGELKVESKEGEGAEFSIELPIDVKQEVR